jgi:hypothetical protein
MLVLSFARLITVGVVVLTQHRLDRPIFSVFDDLREIVYTSRFRWSSFSVDHALEVLVSIFGRFLCGSLTSRVLTLVACILGEHVIYGDLAYKLTILDRLESSSTV